MNIVTYIMIAMLGASVSLAPRFADAGVSKVFTDIGTWWKSRSITANPVAAAVSDALEEGTGTGETSGTVSRPATPPPAGRPAGMCIVPREPQKIVCELGSGFLCVSTPPGGVAGNFLILKGTIDRTNSVLGSIRVAVQNEYTKKTVSVDTSNPSGSNCWGSLPNNSNFCLSREGHFSARVPLSEKGPHTVSVSATRLSGSSEERRARVSRVVELDLDAEKLEFDPDVKIENDIDAKNVAVSASLLGDCRFCDFIGASTGGVLFTVENTITDQNGSAKKISCRTTVERGGEGKFEVGVPVEAGTNTLKIRACNAASLESGCPEVKGVSFNVKGTKYSLDIKSPPPQPSYDSGEYPVIPWRFSVGGGGCVDLKFNRTAPQKICPQDGGEFSAELNPRVGINVATVTTEDGSETFAWTFGWGKILSPFANEENVIDIPQAVQAVLPNGTVTGLIVPVINNFLRSDEFGEFLEDMFSGKEDDEKNRGTKDEGRRTSEVLIPKCGKSDAKKEFLISSGGRPSIQKAEIKNILFDDDKAGFSVLLEGVRAKIDLAPDKDGDGKGDKDPLPLIIKMRRALLDMTFEISKDADGSPLILIGSPHNDCDFKKGYYCTHAPAALIPQNLVGGKEAGEGFIECDTNAAGDEALDACRAVNTINAQTGIIAEKVLDAINNSIYCGGSAFATKFARGGSAPLNIKFGCGNGEDCEGIMERMFAPVEMPVSLNLKEGVDISSSRILLGAGIAVGNEDVYSQTPSETKIPSSGIIVGDSFDAAWSEPSFVGKDISASLSLDALNAVIYSAVAQGDGRVKRGILDLDISESFLNDIGLDFVKSCDAFVPPDDPNAGEAEKKPPMWCLLRPRVGELLGTPLTTYGYFEPKQPLLVEVRANRALSPRVAVTTLEDLQIVPRAGFVGSGEDTQNTATENVDTPGGSLLSLEIGGLSVSFLALKIDESEPVDAYNNLPVAKGPDGRPVAMPGGPIITFDLTLLLGIEAGQVELDTEDSSKFLITVRPLADRSRLVLSPIEGTNTTIVPPAGMIATLEQEILVALADRSSPEKAIRLSIPKEAAFAVEDSKSFFGRLGLTTIAFGEKGISLNFDPAQNSVNIALQAVVSQLLHEDGKEMKYSF